MWVVVQVPLRFTKINQPDSGATRGGNNNFGSARRFLENLLTMWWFLENLLTMTTFSHVIIIWGRGWWLYLKIILTLHVYYECELMRRSLI